MEMTASPAEKPIGRTAPALALVSVLAYLACLAGPGFEVPSLGPGGVHPGVGLLVVGPIGVALGYFAWLANPALWVSWVLLFQKRYGGALKAGLTAVAFGLTFLAHDRIPVGSSGDYRFVVGWGYWAWLVSMALAVVAAVAGLVRQFRTRAIRR